MIARRLGRLDVRIAPREDLPVAALRVVLRGGARTEERPGEALLLGRLLVEGSGERDWRRVAEEAEERGMSLTGYASHETIGIGIECLAEDVERAVDWLAEMLLDPRFPEERVAWARRQAIGELRSMADQPEVVAGRAFLEQLYGAHPYARPLQGTGESLAEQSAATCREVHRRELGRAALVAVAGHVDAEALAARIEARFGAAFAAPARNGSGPVLGPEGADREVLEVPDPGQAHLLVGRRTIPRSHPDWWPLVVAGVVLGAGPGLVGRLPDRIREREGLAYHVDVVATAGAGTDAGRFAVYVGTSPDTVEAAETAVREELAAAVARGLDDEEVEEARSWLLGRRPFRRETTRGELDAMVQATVFDLPGEPDRVDDEAERTLQELDRHRVEEALRRWMAPDGLRVTIGLPRAEG